jgi:hypothetical protein
MATHTKFFISLTRSINSFKLQSFGKELGFSQVGFFRHSKAGEWLEVGPE